MSLTTIILLVLVLYVLQLFLQEVSRFGLNVTVLVGNRDNPPDMTAVAARLDRAKNNMMEAMPLFLALALLAMVKGVDTSSDVMNGAMLFLAMRVLFIPAYASGLPWFRSIFWIAANVGLIMMALPLI
ncbi:MAPEG family protein [Kordiimonas marina]|uniref:MAPEG family protein n=1 Tax=Kordiimonas marina TaxID=2872312 RepID=UPI001FF5F6DF|nr:MAPEG family protein [Kordiimonas marina]MCJ9427634.1 MAPEG family protein [Kordiimonas marina]